MDVDFKTIMLLLSVALGLSLTIERILEFVKGLIAKMLLREDSDFAPRAPSVEEVIADVGCDKIDAVLDDKVQEIEELYLQLDKAPAAKKTALQEKINQIEQEGLELINNFQKILDELGTSSTLTKVQKSNLIQKKNHLDEWIRDDKLKTDWAEYDERFSEATVLIDTIAPRDPEKTAREFWLQIIGTLSGVIICYFSKFGIYKCKVFSCIVKDFFFEW